MSPSVAEFVIPRTKADLTASTKFGPLLSLTAWVAWQEISSKAKVTIIAGAAASLFAVATYYLVGQPMAPLRKLYA